MQVLRADAAPARRGHTHYIRRDILLAATIICITMVVSAAISAAASQYAGPNTPDGAASIDGIVVVVTDANLMPVTDSVVQDSSPIAPMDEAAFAPANVRAEAIDPAPPATVLDGTDNPDPELIARLRAHTASKAEATDSAVATDVSSQSVIHNVNITFYDCATQNFCGHMYGGRVVHEGAAACSWNLALGTQFRIVGDPTARTYTCEDRGMLTNTWVDIFFYSQAAGYRWAANVDRVGTIEIVYRP